MYYMHLDTQCTKSDWLPTTSSEVYTCLCIQTHLLPVCQLNFSPITANQNGLHNHSICITRMHCSRMRIVRCSGHLSCHTCPLPYMPPHHACPPAMHVSSPCHARPLAMHSTHHACPLQYMPPCYAQPLPHMSPPVNRITDACENITLPQPRCGW